MPSHLAGILALQRSAGNAAVNQGLAVQRMARQGRQSGNDSDDSGMAYGSLPGPARSSSSSGDSGMAYGSLPGAEGDSFSGRVAGVTFSAEHNGELMRDLRQFIADVSTHFSDALEAAGSVTVRFGRTEGGTGGEWRADSRVIMLDPRPKRLFGTAVFEILNASTDRRRKALDGQVRNGEIENLALRQGISPRQYYAREVERIEWRNGMTHRRIMAAAGRSGTSVDLFSAEGDFDSFHRRQVETGHTHSYEFRYDFLRVEAASAATRGNHQSASSSQGTARHP